jgi:hypothetical protein
MLIKLRSLRNWKVEAEDGELGVVIDVLFDDAHWTARYLVVDEGGLEQKEVFLPPDWVHRHSGDIGLLRTQQKSEVIEAQTAEGDDLRSARELLGFRVEAVDGEAGDLDDLAIDDETWTIRHVLVDAHQWWPGGRVLIDTSAVAEVAWGEGVVRLESTREQVKHSPHAE